ncbi:beta/alpha barrel domain-containing protein [Clostridium butyricum]|uniref:homocitrate synthase n=2 Tax=Clostridium butyricum TaxID=1492 RepID=UPI000406060A|nr:homocitrate synthase [Clostridium butyricum]
MKRNVNIVDTTLRDGEQSAGKAFTIEQKLKIAKYLDDNGIYQIECGIPAMGCLEQEIIKAIKANTKNALISTWNRLNIDDIKASMNCKPHIIHISVPVSDLQIYENLNKDKKWIEENLIKCIYYTKEHGYDVTVGLEDASRADIKYIIELSSLIEKLGVNRIRYSDTVGILSLLKTKNVVNEIRRNSNLKVEIHAHNDFGMALGISVEAVKNGAEFVDCTLDGIGERTGNCSLQEFLKISRNFECDYEMNNDNVIKKRLVDIIKNHDNSNQKH